MGVGLLGFLVLGLAAREHTELPVGCSSLVATSTDPAMRWFCQGEHLQPRPWRQERDCTNAHIWCNPVTTERAAQPQLVVFLPGTGLTPHDCAVTILRPRSACTLVGASLHPSRRPVLPCVQPPTSLPSPPRESTDADTGIVADFAGHGFHALSLFYPSTQGQVNCQASRVPNPTDLNCTARERYRVLTGASHSPYGGNGNGNHTNITRPDSIVNRVAKALLTLGPPWSGWLKSDHSPDWPNIVIAGHSNGADHAGFLAKTFNVSRALMIAGANDMVGSAPHGTYSTPAPWQSFAGATPPQRLYGFAVRGVRHRVAHRIGHLLQLAQRLGGPAGPGTLVQGRRRAQLRARRGGDGGVPPDMLQREPRRPVTLEPHGERG